VLVETRQSEYCGLEAMELVRWGMRHGSLIS